MKYGGDIELADGAKILNPAFVAGAVAFAALNSPASAFDFNTQRLTNLGSPTNANDAVNKTYADALSSGRDWKDSVRVATVAALPANTRSGNVLTADANGSINVAGVDGIDDLAQGERILVKNEDDDENNGLYDVTTVGSAGTAWVLTRSADADSSVEVTSGLTVSVEEGTLGGTRWVLTTSGAITLNTTALSFTKDASESTTVSNVGTSGVGVFDGMSGNQINLRKVKSGSAKLTVALNGQTVEIDIVPSELGLPQGYSTDVGDGAATSIAVTHNLGTTDVLVEVVDNATGKTFNINDVDRTNANTVTLGFLTAPATDAYRVLIVSVGN